MKIRVLYVEDEPFLGKIVSETLQLQGFEIVLVADGAEVLSAVQSFRPDVCVLDIMLPNVDGYTLCREIKKLQPGLPILFLTARSETSDLVKGFEAGGTDYIRKPFSMEELIIRIKNQLTLSANHHPMQGSPIPLGKYLLFTARYELKSPGRLYKLSSREMEILSLLSEHRNAVLERRELLMKIWGDDSFFNSRNLDVYIRKLRSMLAEDPELEIVTIKGKGYLFLLKHQAL